MKISWNEFRENVRNVNHRRVGYGRFEITVRLFLGNRFIEFKETTTDEDLTSYDESDEARERTLRHVFDANAEEYRDEIEI